MITKYIKYIKESNNISEVPEIGDVIQIRVEHFIPDTVDIGTQWLKLRNDYTDFINDNLGEVINKKIVYGKIINKNNPIKKVSKNGNPIWNLSDNIINYIVTIKYKNMPEYIEEWLSKSQSIKERGGKYCVLQDNNHVIAFGKTKEEIEIKKSTQKYNI